MCAEIQLTKGFSCVVDDEDVPLISSYRWHAMVTNSGKVYARACVPGADGQWQSKIQMHALIAGALPGEHVDHENGNTLDNRRSNLRRATRSQNMQNRLGASSHSKTGVRGVFWEKAKRRFKAQVILNRKTVFCRRFKTIEEAEIAVKQARAEYMTHSSECKEKTALSR